MSEMIGPDGRPPVFNGAAWVSEDGRYWWNGSDWQLNQKKVFRPPIAVTLIVVAFLAVAGFVISKIPQAAPEPYGVTNMKIDSSTQVEFDYRRSTKCQDLTFNYVFFDKSGQPVDNFVGETHNTVRGDATIHFTINSFTPIASNAVRFVATPTCHD
jgi:phage terminase large subunit-like protein